MQRRFRPKTCVGKILEYIRTTILPEFAATNVFPNRHQIKKALGDNYYASTAMEILKNIGGVQEDKWEWEERENVMKEKEVRYTFASAEPGGQL